MRKRLEYKPDGNLFIKKDKIMYFALINMTHHNLNGTDEVFFNHFHLMVGFASSNITCTKTGAV